MDTKYPVDSAGRLIEQNVPVVTSKALLKEVRELLHTRIHEYETINYIYVIDTTNKLLGVLSIKQALSYPEHTPVTDIMNTNLVFTHPYTHQERAAYLALKNNIKAVPIIDKEKHFLGVITGDRLLSIMYREISEDLLKFAGLLRGHNETDDVMTLSIATSLKHRLPWIIIGLLGGLLIARTIGSFEHTLEKNLTIAAFIPLMVYMSNAVGQQVSAFVIRDSALHGNLPFAKYLFKQSVLVFLIALIMSLLLFSFGTFFYQDFSISRTLGISLFGTIISSIFTGLLIPYTFVKLKLDPANASGPVGTVIQDFLSVIIYFSIASSLL